jgi:hypothetical protein
VDKSLPPEIKLIMADGLGKAICRVIHEKITSDLRIKNSFENKLTTKLPNTDFWRRFAAIFSRKTIPRGGGTE